MRRRDHQGPAPAGISYGFAQASELPAADDGDSAWLLSFADIVTLLLTLFVLLLAISHYHKPVVAKPVPTVRAAADKPSRPIAPAAPVGPLPFTLSSALALPTAAAPLGDHPAAARPVPVAGTAQRTAQPAPAPVPKPGAAAARIAAPRADSAFTIPADLRSQLEVARSATAINLIIKDDVLYPAGSAELSPAGRRVLDRIATLLQQNGDPVSVAGYTDDTPIHTARFPSNWELSAARATNVTRYLITRGVAADRLSAIGYGATRPRADNTSAAGRARNRRVSLVIHLPQRQAAPPPPTAAR